MSKDRNRVLIFGSYDETLHPRIAVLATGLSEHGWEVETLNRPLGSSTAEKVSAAESVWGLIRLAFRVSISWVKLTAGRMHISSPDVVVVGYMGHFDIHLARLLFPSKPIVLDHLVGLADTVADRRLGGSAAKSRLLKRIDHSATNAASLVLVDTVQNLDELSTPAASSALVVPVGATDGWFRARDVPKRRAQDQLSVVFVGVMTPLHGTPVIARAMQLLANRNDIHFTMVGSGQDLDVAKALAPDAIVEWIDWVPGCELPEFVASFDVSLGIFDAGPKAQRVVPNKVYQGLAAGTAVISADTTAMSELLPAGSYIAVPAGDPERLAEAIAVLADQPDALSNAKTAARTGALQFTAAEVTSQLDKELHRLAGTISRLPPLTLSGWARWALAEPIIQGSQGVDVLEIGPGEGAVACRLARLMSYTGVELSERTRRVAKHRLSLQGTPGDLYESIEDIEPSRRFDVLVAFEVLEHIEHDEAALKDWFDRVRPGGRLVISVPAGPHRMGNWDKFVGHFRRYSRSSLEASVQRVGFINTESRYTGFPTGYATEGVRNLVAANRLHGHSVDQGMEDLTEQSSSLLQPPSWAARLTRIASWPTRVLQRPFRHLGTGLILTAESPAGEGGRRP